MQNESVILKHPSQEELLETYSSVLDCIALSKVSSKFARAF